MSDEGVRAALRRLQAEPSLAHRAAWIRARMHAGEVSRGQVRLAAHLGCPASAGVVELPPPSAAAPAELLPVRDAAGLARIQAARRAIVQLHVHWSGPSQRAKHRVADFGGRLLSLVPDAGLELFSLQPELFPGFGQGLQVESEHAQARRWIHELFAEDRWVVEAADGRVLWCREGRLGGWALPLALSEREFLAQSQRALALDPNLPSQR